MEEINPPGARKRAKYFYLVIILGIAAISLYTINMDDWKIMDLKGAISVKKQVLPVPSRNQTTNVSCLIQLHGNTTGGDETQARPTSCEQGANSTVNQKENMTQKSQKNATRCIKKIQLWTYNARERAFPTGTTTINCPNSVCDCKLYSDKRYDTTKICDAVILYHRVGWDWGKMYAARPPGQKWIFYSLESPLHTSMRVIPREDRYNDTYNYIMSYRYESDFRAGYGEYIPGKPEIKENDRRNWAANKSKMVVWVASNCRGPSWPRTEFVKTLSKLLPVDTYGKCGTKACAKNSNECEKLLRQYKFSLSLENSECTDYITEKFWNNLYRGLVPIVYGPPRSDYEKAAPPNSFIHVQDFETMKDLADYVKLVGSNDTLYNSFFEWKKTGSFNSDYTFRAPKILCGVVDRLVADETAAKNGTAPKNTFIKKDWFKWWKGSCFKGRIPQ